MKFECRNNKITLFLLLFKWIK